MTIAAPATTQIALPHQTAYNLLGFRVTVASNSADCIAMLDRLNAEFPSAGATPAHAAYEVISPTNGRQWLIKREGKIIERRTSLMGALTKLEWHIVASAVKTRPDLLYIHGATLAGPRSSVLLPGASGIGKTTFALALMLRGLRLYADDVVFIDPVSHRPLPFPRSPHVHDDALPLLAPLGLRYTPSDHLGPYLCAAAFRPWPTEPGPPLRTIILPTFTAGEPLALEPLTHAEAAVELLRVSGNLLQFPRHGLDLLADLLRGVDCYRLRRNDDLAAAADLVYRLVARPRAGRRA